MEHDIFIIDDNLESVEYVKHIFCKEKKYKFKSVKTENIDLALKNIPDLIIINENSIKAPIKDICNKIRTNEDNSITPIVVISSNTEIEHKIEILKEEIEYFVDSPVNEQYLYCVIKNIIRLININRRVSPLTGLPGNVQIHAELKKRLLNKEEFAVLYLDLDNFKAYNDIYGFLQGDEIIKFTARTILKYVHNNNKEDNFVGHIGGDDFIAIVGINDYEKICQNIIAEFDIKVQEYFSCEDKKRGYLEVANRKNIMEQFPLTSISIGVVVVDKKRFHNILEIGEIGAQVKHIAKTTMGSSYAIDRRK